MSNILITSKAQAKLVDFGLAAAAAKFNDDDAENCPNPRAIDYAALERHTGVKRDDPRSDIYFVGCLFYNMLTGIAPLYETKDRLLRLSIQRFHDIKPIADLEPTLPRLIVMVVNKAMELSPDKRYSTQRDMLADMDLITKRINAGDTGNDLPPDATLPSQAPTLEGMSRTIMFIESNAGMQDLLREKLKQHGYRVLIVSDPDRGMQRFNGAQHVADCVIFSALDLGAAAVEAFNRFGVDDVTREMPAILLIDQRNQGLAADAQLAPHRVTMAMPLKVKELRQVLLKLMQGEPSAK